MVVRFEVAHIEFEVYLSISIILRMEKADIPDINLMGEG